MDRPWGLAFAVYGVDGKLLTISQIDNGLRFETEAEAMAAAAAMVLLHKKGIIRLYTLWLGSILEPSKTFRHLVDNYQVTAE